MDRGISSSDLKEGEGKVFIDGIEHTVKDGDVVIVPAGAQHNVVNTSKNLELKLLYNLIDHRNIKTRSYATLKQKPKLRQKNTMASLQSSRHQFDQKTMLEIYLRKAIATIFALNNV